MKKTLIAGAAGVVLASAVGLAVALPAQAETLTTTTTTISSASETGETAGEHRAGRGHGGKGFDAEALATKLGLTETAVSDAVSAVRDATEAGDRPSSDATDEEREAAKDARQSAIVTALAAELNIDEDTVSAALTDIRSEKTAERAAAATATLDEAVADGTLTQTEADAVQKAMDAHIMGNLDEAVAEGILTQSEADAAQKAIDAQVLGNHGGRDGGNGGDRGDRGHAER